MENWSWIAALADPTFLVLLMVGVGVPLLAVPVPAGPLIAGAVAAALITLNYRLDRSVSKLPVRTGPEAILGQVAVVVEPLAPVGLVRCNGEVWRAAEACGRSIERGERVVVTGVRGLELMVSRHQ